MKLLLLSVQAAVLMLCVVPAAGATTNSFTIVQICDPQLGMTDVRENICSLEQVVKQVNQLNPEFVVICGDLVNTPNEVSFSDFVRIRDTFSVPCHCVPGNHDVGNPPTTNSLARYRMLVGADYYAVRRPGFCFLMLDSQLLKWRIEGETDKLLSWLKTELARAVAGNEVVYVCLHIPLFVGNTAEGEWYENFPKAMRLELLDLFHKHGVRVVLNGHAHRVTDKHEGGIRLFGGETTSTNFDGRPPGFRIWQITASSSTNTFIPLYRRNDTSRGTPPVEGSETGVVAVCRANLRFLDAVKEMAGMAGGLPTRSMVSMEELSKWVKGGVESVKCPEGGAYQVRALGEDPECTIRGHNLPPAYQLDEFRTRAAAQKDFRTRMQKSAFGE